ncbi:MAG: hypothetical protein JWR03_559 [Cohnella sp.]|nr:hypothetical protein [Cohnella sp.]
MECGQESAQTFFILPVNGEDCRAIASAAFSCCIVRLYPFANHRPTHFLSAAIDYMSTFNGFAVNGANDLGIAVMDEFFEPSGTSANERNPVRHRFQRHQTEGFLLAGRSFCFSCIG